MEVYARRPAELDGNLVCCFELAVDMIGMANGSLCFMQKNQHFWKGNLVGFGVKWYGRSGFKVIRIYHSCVSRATKLFFQCKNFTLIIPVWRIAVSKGMVGISIRTSKWLGGDVKRTCFAMVPITRKESIGVIRGQIWRYVLIRIWQNLDDYRGWNLANWV